MGLSILTFPVDGGGIVILILEKVEISHREDSYGTQQQRKVVHYPYFYLTVQSATESHVHRRSTKTN